MDDKELYEAGPPIKVDNTMLSNYESCNRSLYWFMRGLDYKNTPAYFIFGRAFGVAANTWHLGNDGEGNQRERLILALADAKSLWQSEAPIEDSTNSWDNFQKIFEDYAKFYGVKEPWRMAYSSGEKGFAIPLPTFPKVDYCGAIDAPITWKPYGMLVREDKTTGAWINQGYLDQWDYATQVTGYIWAFQAIIGECYGCYMNIAGKTHRRQIEDQYARYLTRRSHNQITQFLIETGRAVERIWRQWDKGGWDWDKTGTRNPMNCAGGMGRKRCPYANLCAQDAQPWELENYNFADEFTWRGKWEPWTRNGSD